MLKRIGEKGSPCLTPFSHKVGSSFVVNFLQLRSPSNYLFYPFTPFLAEAPDFSLSRRKLQHILSYAFSKYFRIIPLMLDLFVSCNTSCRTIITDIMFLPFMNVVWLCSIVFSTTLFMVNTLVIDLYRQFKRRGWAHGCVLGYHLSHLHFSFVLASFSLVKGIYFWELHCWDFCLLPFVSSICLVLFIVRVRLCHSTT